MTAARKTVLICAALFLLNVALNAPFFLPGEGKYRDSIEGGYASMARFVAAHPNPFGWNPLQYRGLPTRVWYLPVIPYTGAAAIHALPMLRPEHVYRLLVVTLACLGPVTLFLFALSFHRSRRWALLAALLYTFWSVSYFFYYAISWDRGISYLPWRIQVLVKYGEGPHNAGLALMPLALMACWRVALGRRVAQLALAAALLALVTLTNWISAVALAWCCAMMLLTGTGLAARNGFLARRLLAAAVLAYLLAAFWLTPRYLATTFLNWPGDAFGFKLSSTKYALQAALLVLPLPIRWAFHRWLPAAHYLCYLVLCLFGFAWIVSAFYWFGIDTIPESRRYAIEVEFFLFLLLAELLRLLYTAGRRWPREFAVAAFGAMLGLGYIQIGTYASRTWMSLRPDSRQETIEYKVSERLAQLEPRGRVWVSGGTRFRLNSWFDVPQLGGTFESGLRNRGAVFTMYHLQRGYGRTAEQRAGDAVNLLKASGVEFLAMHGARSREHWRDINNPGMFAGKLEVVWHEEDDTIYRVPFRSLANLVRPEEMVDDRPFGQYVGAAERYARALDDRTRPALDLQWQGSNRIVIRAPHIPDGYWITVHVSFDGGWRATQDGRPIAVETDYMDNIVLKPAATADSVIRLDYRPTLQPLAGLAVSLITAAALAAAVWRERRG